jgi:hypothetical protein
MCTSCGWLELAATIEVHLERRVMDHTAVILASASDQIQANQHVTPDQRDAVETVIEQYVARVS